MSFRTQHSGKPIASPAILERIGAAFRRAVRSFAADSKIPVVRFINDDPQDRADAAVFGAAGGDRRLQLYRSTLSATQVHRCARPKPRHTVVAFDSQ